MNIITKFQDEISRIFGENFADAIEFNKAEPTRFGKNNHIWCYAKEWDYKGNTYQEIDFGSWKTGGKYTVKSWDKELNKDKNFIKAYKKKNAEVAASQNLDKQKRQAESAKKWLSIYNGAKKCESHDYLTKKGVKIYGDLRVDDNGVLLIPIYNNDEFVGVQRILFNYIEQKFEKRFSSGIKIDGSFLTLGEIKGKIYVAEGYATAASIREAYPDIAVVVCFSGNNIPKCVANLKNEHPDLKICVASDDDETGIKYANQAKFRYSSVTVKVPKFTVKGMGSDWNDLHMMSGLKEVQEQLKIDDAEFAYIKALGHDEGNYYYVSSENAQMVSLVTTQHTELGLIRLISNKNYWYKHYGVVNEETEEVKIRWADVASSLVGQCHAQGLFNPKKVRGTGVWRDGGKYVINDGEKLYNENVGSEFHYHKTLRVNYSLSNFESNGEMLHLLDALHRVNYKNKSDVFYLASFIVQSYIFSVLDWRFHIWVTGEKGAGKSTILKWIKDLSIDCLATVDGTAAGVSQTIKSNAKLVIFDESEGTRKETLQVVELARQMSSNGGFEKVRGTVSGNSIQYNTQCVLCFGSIQIPVLEDADRSRIFSIEIKRSTEQTSKDYAEITERLDYFIKNKNKIFTRAYNAIDIIKYNANFCHSELKNLKLESRLADQLSVAMACFYLYFDDGKMEKENFDYILREFDILNSDYTADNKEKQHDDCYDMLMGTVIDFKSSMTVSEAIENLKHGYGEQADSTRLLGVHGLIYKPSDNTLFIHQKNQQLLKKMDKYPDFIRVLKRDETVFIKDSVRRQIKQLGYVLGIVIKLK